MAYKKFQPANEEGFQSYSLKVTAGTKFAEELLNKTRKMEVAPGKFVMLTPPPINWKSRHEK